MTFTPAQVFQHAAALVDCGWTQGVYARNSAGNPCLTTGPDACSFCLFGAIKRAGSAAGLTDAQIDRLDAFAGQVGLVTPGVKTSMVASWNDAPGRTKEEVSGFLRLTADKVQQKGTGWD